MNRKFLTNRAHEARLGLPWKLRAQVWWHGINLDGCEDIAVRIIQEKCCETMSLDRAFNLCADEVHRESALRCMTEDEAKKKRFGSVWIAIVLFIIEMILRQYFSEGNHA